jgi:hypothetical protein
MSDKNLGQWINIKFCVKIGKSASEKLSLLTVPYGEGTMKAMKKLSVFEWHRRSRKGEKMCKMIQEAAAKNAKDRCKCGQSTNLGALRSKIRRATNRRRIEYE